MGYYVTMTESTVCIPADKVDEAYETLCALNADDSRKTGGSSGSIGKPEDSESVASDPTKWYSWMEWNYDETCEDLVAIFEELRFEVDADYEGNVSVDFFDSKIGAEGLFMNALAPFIPNDQYMIWRGEDGEMWRWVFIDGEMIEQSAKIVWE